MPNLLWSAADLEVLRQYWPQGANIEYINSRLSLPRSYKAMRMAARRIQLRRPIAKFKRKQRPPDYEQRLRAAWTTPRSLYDIAHDFGLSRPVVRRDAAQFGLEPNRTWVMIHRNQEQTRSAWPQARLDRMFELHALGYSSGRIAVELGTTRNAVIGKLHRLGHSAARLNGSGKPPPLPNQPPGPIYPDGGGAPYPDPVPLQPVPIPLPEPVPLPRTFVRNRSARLGGEWTRAAHELPPSLSQFVDNVWQPPVHRLDIERGGCSFPVGSDMLADDYYCGHRRARGSYCEYHARIAYIPPKGRARRPTWRTTNS